MVSWILACFHRSLDVAVLTVIELGHHAQPLTDGKSKPRGFLHFPATETNHQPERTLLPFARLFLFIKLWSPLGLTAKTMEHANTERQVNEENDDDDGICLHLAVDFPHFSGFYDNLDGSINKKTKWIDYFPGHGDAGNGVGSLKWVRIAWRLMVNQRLRSVSLALG